MNRYFFKQWIVVNHRNVFQHAVVARREIFSASGYGFLNPRFGRLRAYAQNCSEQRILNGTRQFPDP